MERTYDDQGNVILEDKDFFYRLCPVSITIPKHEAEEILKRYPSPALPEGLEIKPFDSFEAGQTVKDYLVLIDRLEVKPSNSNPYLNFRCTNSQGEFYGKKWDSKDEPTQQSFELLSESPIQLVSGKVQEFPKGSGKKSFLMDKFLPYSGDLHPMSLLPTTQEDLESLTLEFFHYLYSLNEPYRTMALDIFDSFWKEFALKPAATGYHHNFIGGLLQHTVELLRLDVHLTSAENVEKELSSFALNLMKKHLIDSMENRRKENPAYYNRLPWSGCFDHINESIDSFCSSLLQAGLNRDQVIFGHAMHDIGKIFEYANLGESNKFPLLFPYASDTNEYTPFSGSISIDELGKQLGHMPIGMLILQNYLLQKKVSFPKTEIVQMMNIILSHHGKAEWGSSAKPASPSAWLVHIVDYIDSRYAQNINK